MLTLLRRRLGKLKDRLERRVATIASGGKPRAEQAPISAADKDFMLEWIMGRVDDHALISRARASDTGLGLIERACAARPANARVCAVRAEFCLEAGDLAGAVEHADRAYALGRLEPEVGRVLAKVLVAAGRGADALQVIPPALENARRTNAHATRLELCLLWRSLEPESIEPLLESARTHVAAREFDVAIQAFEALRAKYGPRSDILLPLAAVYQDLARVEDATRVYMEAVEAEPDNVDALCMAGICARDLCDTATADRLLSKAFALDPASSFAQYNLGLLRLDQGRIDEAAQLVLGARAAGRGEPWSAEGLAGKLAAPSERDMADLDWATARFKLVHDLEQFGYLRAHGRVGPELDPVIAEYTAALRDPNLPEDAYSMVALHPGTYPMLSRTYKAPLHAPDPEPPQGPLVNPDLDWKSLEDAYLSAKPGLVVVDQMLAPQALAAVQAFCLESTIWNELRGGYVGAYMPDGFSGRLLLRIASELRARMPRLLREHPLQTMWAYKYDSRYPGIAVHADIAAVNVNFWVTPDAANLDPESGGLVVHVTGESREASVEQVRAGPAAIRKHLEEAGARQVRVPYRANRAVIFDARLFHETDAFRFREGYENRRVNITMLYGTRNG
ncbi:MAG: hypothetical protein JSS40_07785 [Proteobacteria bacterium]|nr:hypothetical protein [Pseudomonadota bacterium]